jgi:hypothetical protein
MNYYASLQPGPQCLRAAGIHIGNDGEQQRFGFQT